MQNIQEIGAYSQFVDYLQTLLANINSIPSNEWKKSAFRAVDGQASEQLREMVNLETRRMYGAFFTDASMAKIMLHALKPKFSNKSIMYDPACGAGNLLLACQELICIKRPKSLQTIEFTGSDLHGEFVEASRLRMEINSILLGSSPKFESSFRFAQLNGLEPNEYYEQATHILINPPFNLVRADKDVKWSTGNVSAAALFMDKVINNVHPGVSIYAILPDVLRSGTRYKKWRDLINSTCEVEYVKLLGQFDKYTDVDVFAMSLTKRKKIFSLKEQSVAPANNQTVGDLFYVCVGPVVDNRDPHFGPQLPYIVSRGLQGWKNVKDINLKRKHSGRSFRGPFIVVKRTSRMGDSKRAIATIIQTKTPVFVDNHLIVLKPKSGKLNDCKIALKNLFDERTDNWLNEQIRCRHLTVSVVSKIPIWP